MTMRIGIDVGGTFTDVTGFDETRAEVVLVRKYSSNPSDPMGVMSGIAADLQSQFGADKISLVLHGSTAGLNTLLEDKGVRVGLLTTAGFRDVYEIGRQWRGDEVFNIFAPAPKMLLRRSWIHEVHGRLDARGEEIESLCRADIEEAVKSLLTEGVQAIAIAFLFAYANPEHERAAAEIVRELAPNLYVTISSDVNPEWREYERTASTVANGYIGPPVSRYLTELEKLFEAHFPNSRTLMMKSDGGAGSAAMLSHRPIQTVMSGPVAGVIGTRYLGDQKGLENLITFDTGGTSSDMAVIPGQPLFKSEVAVARHPLRTRTVDIETIGAGGGSIASVELGGVLKVGPQSAGAWPGPACYGRGGTAPTLTDALVVLGHINPGSLLEGGMNLDAEAARRAVRDGVATPLRMSESEAAWGIVTVLVNNCISAMRTITVERGYDPREFTLVPFGGMGPTIAGLIGPQLSIDRILVPRDPGTFSAWGMLVTDVHQERSLTRLTVLEESTPDSIDAVFQQLERLVEADLLKEQFSRERMHTMRFAGMRYRGQSYEVNVPVGRMQDESDLAALTACFHESHQRRYGHMATNERVEIVNFRVTGVGEIAKPKLPTFPAGDKAPEPAALRRAFFGKDGAFDTPVFQRASLAPGAELHGPSIIEERTSTIVIQPGQRARVDEYLNLEISRGDQDPPAATAPDRRRG